MNLTKQYITASDLDSYKDVTIPYGTIGEIVDTRTYLRWLPELNRRETALERWQRVINYNLSLVSTKHRYDYLRSEALLMLDKFVNMKADVSGRTKWVGGTEASSINPQNNFNCSSTVINRITVFAEIFGLLMNGCGVGFRVFSDDISKLPKFDNRFTSMSFEDYDPLPKDAREEYTRPFFLESKLLMIEVGDSKQGWMDALDIYLDVRCSLNVYLKGTEIIFNVDSVRPMGERIKGFGGTASGPEAFKGIIQDIDRILKESPEDQLRSIDCMDVICAIAKGVVAGSSRRSALISLFEQGDNLMAASKVNLYSDPSLAHKSYRSQSNNTCCLTEEPTLEEIKTLLHTCKTEGEPGFNNFSKMVHNRSEAAKKHRPDNPVEWYTDVLTNPCFDAGTMILTKDGHYPIESLVGKTVEIHDGNDWVEIDNFRVTGEDQEVYTVTLHSGQSITATNYHTFILEDGIRKELRHLVPGDKLASSSVLISSSVKLDCAYAKGFMVGDGTSNKNDVILHLYHTKYMCEDRLIKSVGEIIPTRKGRSDMCLAPGFSDNDNLYKKSMTGLLCRSTEFLPWVREYRSVLPVDSINWDNQSKYDFIAGVMDADGTSSDTRNGFMYQIVSVKREWLVSFQLLLSSIGIKSKLSNGEQRGSTYDFGSNRGGICNVQPSFRLTISQSASILLATLVKFERLQSFANRSTTYKLKDNSNKVVSIEFSHTADEVYCCTVPTNHQITLSNRVITGQCHEISLTAGKTGNAVSFCNLTTLPLPNFVSVHHDGYPDFDWNEFANCLALNTRISMRQTCVEFDNPEWTETQADERLLGVSMTGCQDMFSMMGWKTGSIEIDEFLHFANAVANNEAYSYAKEINIPRPLLVTTTKPEGSSSTIFGTSSGLHWDWAPYYIRRVRMTSKDALALTLLDQGFTAYPELYDLEKVFPDQTLTAWDRIEHFDKFPSATRRALLKECNTIVFEFPVESNSSSTQSEISAREQLESVKAFTNIYCDHMPSSTISVKDDEWDDVANWIKDNWDSYITASFFPYFGAKYPLLPLEAITMEEYQSKLTLIPSESITVLDSGRITFRVNHDLLTAHEQALDKSTDEDLGSDCEKGSCPIR